MFLRFGLLVCLCLALVQCEDEVIKCDGGECVKLHLCHNGTLTTDGAMLIDIRFNPDNECEDYLLKCCPIPEEDLILPPPSPVIPPQTMEKPSPVPIPDPVPGNVPTPTPGSVTPPIPGTGGPTAQVPVPLVPPSATEDHGNDKGSKSPGGGNGSDYSSTKHPDSNTNGTVELIGQNLLDGKKNDTSLNQKKVPIGGGPPNLGGGSGQSVDGSQTGPAHTTSKPIGTGANKPPTDSPNDSKITAPSDGSGSFGGGGGSFTTQKPGSTGATGLNAVSVTTQKPGSSGVPGSNGSSAPSSTTKPNINLNNPNNKPGPALTTSNPILIPDQPPKCGVRNVDGVGFRITGDNDGESEYGEFPWMVAILKEEKALEQVINVYQCGGSLIHPSVVLTAAHCLQNKKASEIKVRLGEWDTQTKNEIYDYQDRNVVEIVSHAEFYKGGLFNDVALLFLENPADIMDTVNTICLPPADYNFDLSRCYASGWGKDVFGKQGTYQVILKKIELPIMPREDCQKALRTTRLGRRFKLHTSFLCAGGEKGRDTCKGDGGSPLMCPIPGSLNQYYQAGMVAWGIGCGEDGIPGVYVNVPMFRGWIDDHLRERNITNNYYLYT